MVIDSQVHVVLCLKMFITIYKKLLPVTTSFVFCLFKYSSRITIWVINSFLLDVDDWLPPILIILVPCFIFPSSFEGHMVIIPGISNVSSTHLWWYLWNQRDWRNKIWQRLQQSLCIISTSAHICLCRACLSKYPCRLYKRESQAIRLKDQISFRSYFVGFKGWHHYHDCRSLIFWKLQNKCVHILETLAYIYIW